MRTSDRFWKSTSDQTENIFAQGADQESNLEAEKMAEITWLLGKWDWRAQSVLDSTQTLQFIVDCSWLFPDKTITCDISMAGAGVLAKEMFFYDKALGTYVVLEIPGFGNERGPFKDILIKNGDSWSRNSSYMSSENKILAQRIYTPGEAGITVVEYTSYRESIRVRVVTSTYFGGPSLSRA